MDNQNTATQNQTPPQDQQAVAAPPVLNQSQSSGPQNLISGPHKELGPVMEAPVAEYVAPSSPHETEPILTPEVKEAGVETVPSPEMPKITEEHKQAGVTPAAEAIPVSTTSTSSVSMPFTYPQVQQQLKETQVEESSHWLAMLHKFILERLGAKG